jgi:HlyD family secretion protein
MTASISFQVGEESNVLRIPNAALRFYPQRDQVRPEDRKILDSVTVLPGETDERTDANRSADERAETRRQRNRRHVWVVDGQFLRAIEIVTGLGDAKNTQLVSGEIAEGQKLVSAIQPKN